MIDINPLAVGGFVFMIIGIVCSIVALEFAYSALLRKFDKKDYSND